MTFPKDAPNGDKYRASPPTPQQIVVVAQCQYLLRQVGLHLEAEQLTLALSRPEFVCEHRDGGKRWWLLSYDSVCKAKSEAEKLLVPK